MFGSWLTDAPGRETFLVKVDWIDDWPVFNEGKNIALLTQGRDPKPEAAEPDGQALSWTADLTKTELELGWYQKSTSSIPDQSRSGPDLTHTYHRSRHAA